jgi:glycolate oxidase
MSKNYNHVTAEIIDELKAIVGAKNVVTDSEKMEPYSHDEVTDSHYFHMPEVVVFPLDVQQVSKIMKLANKEMIPVVPRGAGTGLACGAVPTYGGIVLSVEKMDKIIEINEEKMYMVVEPGVKTSDVQAAAKEKNLLYAGDPCSGDSCFIGGNVATNAGGNRAIKYGTTRDQVYSIEVVTPLGDIVNLGGRLQKVTTGYPLEKIVIGSEGTLGIITKIILKLVPLPKYTLDLLAVFPTVDSAIAIVNKLAKAGIQPTCLEFIENTTIKCIERFLNEKLPDSDEGNYMIIQVDGKDEDALDDISVEVDELCTKNGATTVLVADSDKIWRARKNFSEAIRAECLIVAKEDLVVPADMIPELLKLIEKIGKEQHLVTRMASHAGDGNLHISALKNDTPDELWGKKVEDFHQAVYDGVYALGGRISGEHGIGLKRKELMKHYTNPIELNLMKAVKKAFDPNLILNPGKLFDID